MLGLFGTLNLGTQALATHRKGVEVAGHNLANVNNPAYSRQRLAVQTASTVSGEFGAQGMGAVAVAVTRIRSEILDGEITTETSVTGSLEAQQRALQFAQTGLGQQLDPSGTTGVDSVGTVRNLADNLSELFDSFQTLSTDPASMSQRKVLLQKANNLAQQFNRVDQRLTELNDTLNQSIASDVDTANGLLSEIAGLNERIGSIESTGDGAANDLRDLRQEKLEALAKFVRIDVREGEAGALDIDVAGTNLLSNGEVRETLEAFSGADGRTLVRAASTDAPLTLTGGSLHGTIEARDGAITRLHSDINALASELIQQVNTLHAGGFALDGSTGRAFFNGTNASDITVNSELGGNLRLVQAAGATNAAGDNRVALALAQLRDQRFNGLANQTFTQSHNSTVAELGESLAEVNSQLADQQSVQEMLSQHRASVSGVSLDEEMADLTRFQKAFEASARLISTVDEMLDTVIGMKR